MASSPNASSAQSTSKLWLWSATAGGLGYLPFAPGTWGAGAALFAFYGLAPLGWAAYALVLGTTLFLGTRAASAAEHHLGHADDGRIVIDEVAGQLIALAPLVPLARDGAPNPYAVILAFLLFRLLDIWKPGPVRWAERRFKGGIGVMADDVVAGALAAVSVWLFVWVIGVEATP